MRPSIHYLSRLDFGKCLHTGKNFLTRKSVLLTIILICLGILLTSCGSKVWITKRHYNSGYYIAHSKGNQWGTSKDKNNAVANKTIKTAFTAKKQMGQPVVSGYSGQIPLASDRVAVANLETRSQSVNTKPVHRAVGHKHPLSILQHPANIFPVSPLKGKLERVKKVGGVDVERDALSLFWIVILVILVLWLIGFLANGFGLGGLINLLLVVAAVLLVLWLLRIV